MNILQSRIEWIKMLLKMVDFRSNKLTVHVYGASRLILYFTRIKFLGNHWYKFVCQTTKCVFFFKTKFIRRFNVEIAQAFIYSDKA